MVESDIISDNHSQFQGFSATVTSVSEVKDILIKVTSQPKCYVTSHNIYVYALSEGEHPVACNDDGEYRASGLLLNTLRDMNCVNCVVIVSRWYGGNPRGGNHLGRRRFIHITDAAKQAISRNQGITIINEPTDQPQIMPTVVTSNCFKIFGDDRCNRLRCPLARMSGLQCFNMGHNGHGINLYGVSMTPMGN